MPVNTPKLSDLELAALGVIHRLGPVTPYRIRKEFLDSPSTIFSGSAGAIYPLLARLEARRLVASASQATGKRASRAYRLTPAGKWRLIDWLNSPMGRDEASDYDPIRVRLHFLSALTASKRRTFLDNAELALTEQKQIIERHCKNHQQTGDLIDYHAARGGLHTVRARIKWIREIRNAMFEKTSAGGESPS